jgi:hypothetical protein
MSDLPEEFDPSTVESNTWDLIPVGEYLAEIIEARIDQPKSLDGYHIRATWKILSGEYEGRQVWQTITFLHSNKKAQEIGQKSLKDFCTAMGIEGTLRNTDVLLFKPVKIKVGVEKDKNGVYDDKNKVMWVKPFDSTNGATTAARSPKSPPNPTNGTTAAASPPKPPPAPSASADAANPASSEPSIPPPWESEA